MLMGKDWTRKSRVVAVLWKWLISHLLFNHFWQFQDFEPLQTAATSSHKLITDWHCCNGWHLLVYDCSCGLWSSPACIWYKHLLPINLHWWIRLEKTAQACYDLFLPEEDAISLSFYSALAGLLGMTMRHSKAYETHPTEVEWLMVGLLQSCVLLPCKTLS